MATTDCFLQEAFEQVVKDAKRPEGFYVSLMERGCEYGGPEEGGWWRYPTRIVAYKHCSTEEEANTVKRAVEKLAKELANDARREYGEKCLRECEWCEDRGLEADYLPEPDGPSDYYVVVTDGLPEESCGGPSHYE